MGDDLFRSQLFTLATVICFVVRCRIILSRCHTNIDTIISCQRSVVFRIRVEQEVPLGLVHVTYDFGKGKTGEKVKKPLEMRQLALDFKDHRDPFTQIRRC